MARRKRQGRLPELVRASVRCAMLVAFLLLGGEPTSGLPACAGEGDEPSLTLVLVGDVMLGRGVARWLDGDWEAAFRGVGPWLAGSARPSEREHVLTFANLESPLTDAPQLRDGHDLRAPPAAVAALREAGFDAVSLANNHALDAGVAGLGDTVRTLRAAGIAPWIDPSVATAGSWIPAGDRTRVPAYQGLAFDDSAVPLDVQAAAVAVAAAAAQAEAVVVSIHWGSEYQAAPSSRQEAIARTLAEAGADVIVGHGPHVLQRVERIGGTLVVYSLGNFLFDQPYPVDCRWGAILRVTLRDGHVTAAEAYPTLAERGRVRPADPETARDILAQLGLDGRTE